MIETKNIYNHLIHYLSIYPTQSSALIWSYNAHDPRRRLGKFIWYEESSFGSCDSRLWLLTILRHDFRVFEQCFNRAVCHIGEESVDIFHHVITCNLREYRERFGF